jgi:poly(3-hydroxybutyrate) depolymerase
MNCHSADTLQKTWQGFPGHDIDDIQFTQDLLDSLTESYCIDKSRIWASGKSDGGGFAGLLACDNLLSQQIAAFAPVSGAFYVKNKTKTCHPVTIPIPCDPGSSSIPFLEFHGGQDRTIPYDGGPLHHECLPQIPYYLQAWATRDRLETQNTTSQLTNDTLVFRFGADGLVTGVYDVSIPHDWPSTFPNPDNERSGHQPATFNATTLIMDFFHQHGNLSAAPGPAARYRAVPGQTSSATRDRAEL